MQLRRILYVSLSLPVLVSHSSGCLSWLRICTNHIYRPMRQGQLHLQINSSIWYSILFIKHSIISLEMTSNFLLKILLFDANKTSWSCGRTLFYLAGYAMDTEWLSLGGLDAANLGEWKAFDVWVSCRKETDRERSFQTCFDIKSIDILTPNMLSLPPYCWSLWLWRENLR